MVLKTKKIIARITESQQRWLTEVLIKEQRTKSQVLRDALNLYLIEKSKKNENPERNDKQSKRHE